MQLRLTLLAFLFLLATPLFSQAKETKDVQFKFDNADPVVFSHDIHLKQYNNNCRICHNAIFDLRKRRHFTMAEMEKTKSCGACHSGVKTFSVADEKSCDRCHKGKPRNITYKVKGATDAAFSHNSHLKSLGGKCKSCHNGKVITGKEGRVTMAQMEKGKTCGACHNGSKAFTVAGNCGNCHKGMTPKELTFKTKGISAASFSHKVHTGMFSCKDCHTKIFSYKAGAKHFTMEDMGKGKSCGACHNGKEAFSSSGDCDKCHKGFKPGNITFKTDSGDATFSHDFHLGMYKCIDCHTKVFPYKAGAKHATMGQMESGASCGACHNAKDAFSVAGDCEKCHKM
ncbi:cytochrome c, 12 heme-binding sites [Geotalea daltonii FRC-32]|uniref:Cytochrome c, 12 heme-binding sites n=1 Tax=Geotalea daltonii (strain DSM 22248 / JCM 15807 / FRC-32) TaxID=316067 RepID=B9LZI0_GEODF|nr:cytochrome c3 family protein [Geotalea daltonii]ACM20733.1 cytochrome c, 12 heme-binding sites [Geotalea daltonii FRC-32]